MISRKIRIGISGWRYAPWRGAFYPANLPQRLELWYASRIFSTIEINGSFYSLQRPEYFEQWYRETPDDFIFAVKGPRFITHMKRVREVETPLANFFASGVFNLREKLGPILWQFPPQFRFDAPKLEQFFALLPTNTEAALRLARKRDHRLKGRARLAIDARRPLRHAIEIRHESFLDARFVELLRRFGIALVIAETAKRWPLVHDITANFVYLRLHGDKTLYQSGYGDRALGRWAEKIAAWHRGKEPKAVEKIARTKAPASGPRDVFCYFDNTDVKLRAPVDAQTLMRKLGLTPGAPPALEAHRPRNPAATHLSAARFNKPGSSRMPANVQ
ncbi:MAG: DUF72 domain-containing protein [Xanthomonadaceae bacterium]|nr:DUF72 domain-containing protein [Xanthomonadaceae bacterium]